MTVYWEYAFAENFMLDCLLLYLSLLCAKRRVSVPFLLLAAGVGGAEAVVFPMFSLPVWAAYAVKFLGGAVLPLLAVRRAGAKTYLLALSAFFALTFAMGGMLTAIYSFFNIEYIEGNGYLVERAPVGLVVSACGLFAIFVIHGLRALYRHAVRVRNLVSCKLYGEREVEWTALADSGNLLLFRGRPVCVLSAAGVYALLGREAEEMGRMTVSTVNGERETPVFRCPRMEVEGRIFEDVPLAVGNLTSKDCQIILHIAYTEGQHETSARAQRMAAKDKGKRKRRSLPVRERSVAPASLLRGGGRASSKIGGGRGRGEGEGEAHRA